MDADFSAARDEHTRALRRRRKLRAFRRGAVTAAIRLAHRSERFPAVAGALRAASREIDDKLKLVETRLAPQRARRPPLPVRWREDQALAEYRNLFSILARDLDRVEQPMVLLSGAPRSGGTLLLRLFEGHPQCHVVPHELERILPSSLPLPRDPDRLWAALHDPQLDLWFLEGVRQTKRTLTGDRSRRRFLLPPILQRQLLDVCLERMPADTDRALLDCYLTSYFNAWLNYRGVRGPVARRWVVGFEPGAVGHAARHAVFSQLYPDGRLVSVVREPAGWWVSARLRNAGLADERVALELWRASVAAAVAAKEQRPDETAIVSFERLVGDTEATMRSLARFLGLDVVPELLSPTFNGVPMKPNSSFRVAGSGLSAEPLRRSEELPADHAAAIRREHGPLYEQAVAAAL